MIQPGEPGELNVKERARETERGGGERRRERGGGDTERGDYSPFSLVNEIDNVFITATARVNVLSPLARSKKNAL